MKVNNQEESDLTVHYYLNDNSHSMDAFVRNSIEKDLLDTVKEIGNILGVEIRLESKAYKFGGLIEFLTIGLLPAVAIYLRPTVNTVLTELLTGKIKERKLKNISLENNIKKDQSESKDDEIDIENNIINNKSIKRKISNFYKKVEKYEKITKIGFKVEYEMEEEIIERSEFKNFILENNIDKETDDEANIEVISPVLNIGKFKWRGNYKGEKIEFSMADSKFKEEIISGKYEFANGTIIHCSLEITKTFDDFGDECKKNNYRVLKVYEIKKNNNENWYRRKIGTKKINRKFFENQIELFDTIDKID